MESPADPPRELIGRRTECAALDRFAGDVRAGRSRALLVHGEPGVGKTALLDYLSGQSSGCRLIRVAGTESEVELPFAGLHQLCAPLLTRLGDLPVPQRDALRTVFGMSKGPVPHRFLIGLAVLGLVSDAAQDRPLLCLIDDFHWLDPASARVLVFVARRLHSESVGLAAATRVVTGDVQGLPDLPVHGLRSADASALLDTVLTGPVDARVRDQLIADAGGNPLALLELPRGLGPAELAGGFGLPGAWAVTSSIEESFRRRAEALPAASRELLLIAACDPAADPALVWRAAGVLGIDASAATPATDAGLVELGTKVRFQHPLVRSALYRSAPASQRRRVHGVLAQVIDGGLDPDRKAWHRAHAAAGPDEAVALELLRSAGRAKARGGAAAAAAFLRRAATLTREPALRSTRALDAAEAHLHAGAFDTALELLALAEAGPLDDPGRARAGLVRARLAFVSHHGNDAPALLVTAAARLAPTDPSRSRTTYLEALSAAIFSGRLARPGGSAAEIARAVAAAPPPPHRPRAADLLLDGTAATVTEGYSAGLPALRRALEDFEVAGSELHWLWLASTSAMRLWDDAAWDALSARHVTRARESGDLGELPLALVSRAYFLLFSGDLAAAAALAAEAEAVNGATGGNLAPYGPMGLAAFRGDGRRTTELTAAAIVEATRRGEGVGITFAEWAIAMLHNGLGRPEEALLAAAQAVAREPVRGSAIWPSVELVEAAVRTQNPDAAAEVHRSLAEMTDASGTDWALGLERRCRALMTPGPAAEDHYRAAIDHLGRTRMRADLARAHLVFGEWLRHESRHHDARDELRTAHTAFTEMGMAAFAERAARELRAAGGSARKRVPATADTDLTAQEAQIARLAGDGLSNGEIASRLLVSSHTINYHLRKVFVKLGVSSRSQLKDRVAGS